MESMAAAAETETETVRAEATHRSTAVRTTRRAVVGGDTPSAVARTVGLIEGLGFSVHTCDGVLDVLGHVNGRRRADLVVLELGRDAWIYFALIEVLVREHHPIPLLALTERSEWLPRLRVLEVPVLIRPFDRSKLEATVEALLADGHDRPVP